MLIPGVFLLTVGLLVARLLTIGQFGFFADEAYYWLWSENLAFGYYDHPPIVALFIRAGTILFGDSEFGVRFLGAVSVAVDVALIYGIAIVLFKSRRTAAWAAILANLTTLTALSVITLPDQPMIMFWLAGFYGLARIARDGSPRWWLLVGAMLGLSAASKFTVLFTAAAIPIWLALVPDLRKWFRSPWPYAGAVVAMVILLPVILWNIAEGWPSIAIQLNRESFDTPHFDSFLLYAGLLPVAATPFIAILAVVGLVQCLRSGWRMEPGRALIIVTPIPLFLYLAQHSLWEVVDPHWISPIVFLSSIFAAISLGQSLVGLGGRIVRWTGVAAVVFGTMLTVGTYAALAGLWLPFSALDMYTERFRGWTEYGRIVEAKMLLEGADYVVASNYGIASQLRFYMRDLNVPIYHIGEWGRGVFGTASPELAGGTALYVGHYRDERYERNLAEIYYGDVTFTGEIARPMPEGGERAAVTFVVRNPKPAAAPLFGNPEFLSEASGPRN